MWPEFEIRIWEAMKHFPSDIEGKLSFEREGIIVHNHDKTPRIIIIDFVNALGHFQKLKYTVFFFLPV